MKEINKNANKEERMAIAKNNELAVFEKMQREEVV